jgi:heme A synthase
VGSDAGRSAGRAPRAERLAAAFGALVVLCFGLIVLGALVRANQAGLACPDWPLCFGQILPEMDLRVGFEWTHRLVAGCLVLSFAALSVLALRRPASRRAAPLLGVGAALFGVQILLGALTVWKLLAPWTVTLHLLTGNSIAATLLLAALALREGARPRARAKPPAPARLAIPLAAALLALQRALGGLVASRYAGLACPEWPTCADGVWFPAWEGPMGLQLLHRANGYALVACLAGAAFAARRAPALRPAAFLALALGVAQVAVGAANVWLRLPVEVTGLHSALAAGLVLCVTWTAREVWLARNATA